ncbi:hypothetical protein [Primorskyibacter sp. S87]|uniref:hypothetical protein n=1 Tax=Primorskyibacter sp. S87 TaxID=3415126 RepID=UPI003C7EA725
MSEKSSSWNAGLAPIPKRTHKQSERQSSRVESKSSKPKQPSTNTKTQEPRTPHKREVPQSQPVTEADKIDAVASLFEEPDGSDTLAENSSGVSDDEQQRQEDHVEVVSSLVDGSPANSDDDDDNRNSPITEEDDDSVSLASVAEALEVEPADLYEVQVPLGDGETVTLGQLKDAYKDQTEAERILTERRSQADQREVALMQEQHFMQNMFEALKGQITPEMAQYISNHDKQVDAEERLALSRVVPDLQGKTDRVQFFEKAVKRMATVTGRSEQESAIRLGMLRGRGSALDIKFLHAAIEAFEELDRLKGYRNDAERHKDLPKTKRSGGKRGVADRLTRAKKLAAGGTDADIARGVSELLGG